MSSIDKIHQSFRNLNGKIENKVDTLLVSPPASSTDNMKADMQRVL
jgi:hypothetical protein